MKNIILFFLLAFSSLALFSQENNNITIGLKDNHYANVTVALLTKDEKSIITSDETGKILLLDATNFNYIKTIREGFGIPINDMRLAQNDSKLMISQKNNEIIDLPTDSLIGINLSDNKIYLKNKESVYFLGTTKRDVVITKLALAYGRCYIGIYQEDLKEKTYSFESDGNIDILEISKDKSKIIYTEGDVVSQKNIIVREIATNRILKQIPIKEKTKILHLFFDNSSALFYALCYLEDEKKLVVFKFQENTSWDDIVFASAYEKKSRLFKIAATENDNNTTIIINSLFCNPTIIQKKESAFTSSKMDLNNDTNLSLPISSKNEILFYQNFNSNFTDFPNFYVYNTINKLITSEYPKNHHELFKGVFLPKDNWLAVGEEYSEINGTIRHDDIKYFTAGTFNNRFAKLNLKDYLELKHNITSYSFKEFLDKKTGKYIFRGSEKDKISEGKSYYYQYDLISDKVIQIYDDQKDYDDILDFNSTKKLLLLSKDVEVNGYTFQKIIVLDNQKKTLLSQEYETAKFSNDGNYLLTINDTDLTEIINLTSNKIVFKQQLKVGSSSVEAINQSNFIISNTPSLLDFKNCNSQSIFIEIKDNKSTSKVYDCSLVTNTSWANEKSAFIFDNKTVLLDDKILKLKPYEIPTAVSLNSDATKLMVSFSNGKMIIYDTNTLQELATIVYPNRNSHILFDNKGNYFSNSDAEDYLYATKNNQSVSLKSIENETFNPEKILSLFGQPNEEYLKALEKAIRIRNETKAKTNLEADYKELEQQNNELGKPNLYLVSIGVSDYKQSNFNLTFADKDANDIAQIYGKFNKKELSDYKDKYYGSVFKVHETKETIAVQMKKYLGTYTSTGNFFLVNSKENKWLEVNYDKMNLWNFNTQAIDSLAFPKDFKISEWGNKPQLYSYPDGSGFGLKGEDSKILNYNFADKKTTVYQIPPDIKSKQFAASDTDSYSLISEKEVLFFDYVNLDNSTKIVLTYYDIINSKKNKELEINLVNYKTTDANGISNSVAFERYQRLSFEGASFNGKYILFSNNESMFLVDAEEKNSIPLKIDFKIDYGNALSISSDGKTICVLKTNENGVAFNSFVYTIVNKKIENISLTDNEYAIRGFSIYDAKPRWVEISNPLLSDTWNLTSNDLLNDNKPYSFEKVFVANLVNKEANSKTIKETLSTFFKNSKKNDQIMIFLAGHGMLDTKKQYYFAPHDMDFKNVDTNGISFEFIVNSLKNAPASNKLLLMDSCHSGNTLDETDSVINSAVKSNAIASNTQRGSIASSTKQEGNFKVSEVVSSLFDNFLSNSGVTILSASSGSDVAYENKKQGNGAFTFAYIELLKAKFNSYISSLKKEDLEKSIPLTKDYISEFFKNVMDITQNKQVPDLREINEKSEIKLW